MTDSIEGLSGAQVDAVLSLIAARLDDFAPELLKKAQELVQTPVPQPASIVGPATGTDTWNVLLDQPDDAAAPAQPVVAQNMTGETFVARERVMVQVTPPHGLFIVGVVGSSQMVPIGTSWFHDDTSPPPGWLVRDGSAISRTTYPVLHSMYAARSYPYGAGDGSTTFNLADDRGRLFMGSSGAHPLGSIGGAESASFALTIAQLPPHTHPNGSGVNVSASGGARQEPGSSPTANTGATGSGNPITVPTLPPFRVLLPIVKVG